MENKIIFLDIDGPIIPITVDPYDSLFRLKHNYDSILYLNNLCFRTGAKIVTNSMHNYEDFRDGTLKDDLIKWGIKPEYFHDEWKTIFPHIDYSKVTSKVRGIGRLIAINHWLSFYDTDKWVCFDDRLFTDLPNLIHIEDGLGIKETHFQRAMDILGKKKEFMNEYYC